MGWYNQYVKIIDLLKFRSLRIGCSGHSRKLFIHPEVILKGNGSQGLILFCNVDTFLCLNGLM
ncbi:hypothetical protein ES703_95300 [subsurface metagenome]